MDSDYAIEPVRHHILAVLMTVAIVVESMVIGYALLRHSLEGEVIDVTAAPIQTETETQGKYGQSRAKKAILTDGRIMRYYLYTDVPEKVADPNPKLHPREYKKIEQIGKMSVERMLALAEWIDRQAQSQPELVGCGPKDGSFSRLQLYAADRQVTVERGCLKDSDVPQEIIDTINVL